MTQGKTSPPHRHLPLPGTYNVRDLGGYQTSDGRMTRWRTFFRADSLHRLSPEAQTTLLAHGLRSVIDLRRSDELHRAPNVFASSTRVSYHHLSLLLDTPPQPGVLRPLDVTYRYLLDERQEQMYTALYTLATPGNLPAIVHCTAGKDRTGLLVALLLGLAGVPEATIAADYALSAQYLGDAFYEETRQRIVERGETWEQYLPLMQCPPELMRATLAYLQERYGGSVAYARAIGLGTAHITRLQAALLS
jgi:protein-tyrosine phosphatase